MNFVRLCRWIQGIGVIAAMFLAPVVQAAGQLVVTSSESDPETATLYLYGENFGTVAPSVRFATFDTIVRSFGNTSLAVTVPYGLLKSPGTYLVKVSAGSFPEQQASLDVTTGVKGPAGPKGDKGDTGATGARGLKGDKGDPGAKGDTGLTGTTGLKGDKGDPGAKGDKGDTGLTGSIGPEGKQGSQGERGFTGATGAKGDPGVKGDKGDKGDQGVQGPRTFAQCGIYVGAQVGPGQSSGAYCPGNWISMGGGCYQLGGAGAISSAILGNGYSCTLDPRAPTTPNTTVQANVMCCNIN